MKSTCTFKRRQIWVSRLLISVFFFTSVAVHLTEARLPFVASSSAPRHGRPLRYRGGSSERNPYTEYRNNADYLPPQEYQPQQQQQPQPPPEYEFPPDEASDPFHETVQSRVDTWKTRQREYAESVLESPRDEQGRMKLLTSVSKGSRAIIFVFLMWRDVHLYEVADQTTKGIKRLLFVTPLILLFIANMAGAVASLSSPSHSAKRRLKAILNMDKLVEAILIIYSFIRLTVFPSKHTPREVFISSIFHSFLFILQCQGFTRLSWDEHAAQPMNSYGVQGRPAQRRELEDQQSDDFYYENPFQRQY